LSQVLCWDLHHHLLVMVPYCVVISTLYKNTLLLPLIKHSPFWKESLVYKCYSEPTKQNIIIFSGVPIHTVSSHWRWRLLIFATCWGNQNTTTHCLHQTTKTNVSIRPCCKVKPWSLVGLWMSCCCLSNSNGQIYLPA
jgi:hypothetical protein